MASDTASRLVEAVRVHGGEGVSATVGVHTPDLPHSLAWLDPGGRLSFGEVDHTTHLRWFTLGMCSLRILSGLHAFTAFYTVVWALIVAVTEGCGVLMW